MGLPNTGGGLVRKGIPVNLTLSADSGLFPVFQEKFENHLTKFGWLTHWPLPFNCRKVSQNRICAKPISPARKHPWSFL